MRRYKGRLWTLKLVGPGRGANLFASVACHSYAQIIYYRLSLPYGINLLIPNCEDPSSEAVAELPWGLIRRVLRPGVIVQP
jgi:hypothetical protein